MEVKVDDTIEQPFLQRQQIVVYENKQTLSFGAFLAIIGLMALTYAYICALYYASISWIEADQKFALYAEWIIFLFYLVIVGALWSIGNVMRKSIEERYLQEKIEQEAEELNA